MVEKAPAGPDSVLELQVHVAAEAVFGNTSADPTASASAASELAIFMDVPPRRHNSDIGRVAGIHAGMFSFRAPVVAVPSPHGTQPPNVKRWAAVPLQSWICSRSPCRPALFGSSRQRPDAGLRRLPSAWVTHACAPEPLQSHNCTGVLFAVAPWVTSRHLANARRVTSPGADQRCASLPLQPHSCVAVPEAGSALATSTHRLAGPVIRLGGNRQSWPVDAVQSASCSATTAAPFGDVRQRPDAGFTSSPLDCNVQFCAPVPSHVNSWTGVPFAVPPPAASRQALRTRTAPPAGGVTVWPAEWSHASSSTGVWLADEPPRAARHRPPAPSTSPALGLAAAEPSSATVWFVPTDRLVVVTVTVRELTLYDHAVSGTRTPSTVTAVGARALDSRSVYARV